MNMNTMRRIIVAAFITMLLCNVVVAYTYRPMPSRDDYNIGVHGAAQTSHFNAEMNAPHTSSTKDLSSYKYDVSNVVARTKQHYTAGLAGRAFGDVGTSRINELGRIPRILMRGGSQGIPKPTKLISYGKRTYDAPCPTPEQSPSMNAVSVIGIIASMALLLRRRTA